MDWVAIHELCCIAVRVMLPRGYRRVVLRFTSYVALRVALLWHCNKELHYDGDVPGCYG